MPSRDRRGRSAVLGRLKSLEIVRFLPQRLRKVFARFVIIVPVVESLRECNAVPQAGRLLKVVPQVFHREWPSKDIPDPC